MPKQINSPFVSSNLVRLFSLKGRFQPVLDEVIVPVVNVGDVTEERVKRHFAAFQIGTAAGAGNVNQCVVENPANSGVVITITEFWAVSGTANDEFAWRLVQGAAGASNPSRWKDSSLWGVPKAVTVRSAVVAFVIDGTRFPVNVVMPGPIIMHPGCYLPVWQLAANSTMVMYWNGYEQDVVF